jgi:hypothetical protein
MELLEHNMGKQAVSEALAFQNCSLGLDEQQVDGTKSIK